jgi:hypothetical protein
MRFKSIISEMLLDDRLTLEAKDPQEAKKEKIATIQRVFGFSPEWGEAFYDVNNKMCLWVADTFLKKMKEIYPVNSIERDSTITRLNNASPKSGEWTRNFLPKYRFVFDWFINVNGRTPINLKALSLDEAYAKSEEWHESRDSKKDSNYKEENEIVIDYRDKSGVGFYWVNLGVSYSKEEADRMGHCGNKHGTTLFSLRSINEYGEGESFVTLARQNDDDIVSEIHGKKNSKPKLIYQKYIIDFLLNERYPVKGLTLRGVYKPEHNFQLTDLSEEQVNFLFDKNRDIKTYFVLGEDTEIIAKNIDDQNIHLARKNKKMYGIVDLDTVTIIKPFKYAIASHSDFTDFVTFGDEVYMTKEFNSSENDDKFFTKQFWYNKNKDAHTKLYAGDLPKNQFFSFTSEEEISELQDKEEQEDNQQDNNKKGEN